MNLGWIIPLTCETIWGDVSLSYFGLFKMSIPLWNILLGHAWLLADVLSMPDEKKVSPVLNTLAELALGVDESERCLL